MNPSFEYHDEFDENAAVVPMVEILLVILLFFIVTYASAGQFPVPAPIVPDAPGAERHPLLIVINVNGRPTVDGHPYSVEDLRLYLESQKPTSILIVGNRKTWYENVVAIRNICTRAGVAKVYEGVQRQ